MNILKTKWVSLHFTLLLKITIQRFANLQIYQKNCQKAMSCETLRKDCIVMKDACTHTK